MPPLRHSYLVDTPAWDCLRQLMVVLTSVIVLLLGRLH